MYKIINIGKPKYFTDLIRKREIGTILEIEIFIAELKILKIHFSHILSRLDIG